MRHVRFRERGHFTLATAMGANQPPLTPLHNSTRHLTPARVRLTESGFPDNLGT